MDNSRIVPRPVPQSQVQDPREFQLAQIRRRFAPKEQETDGGTSLTFKLIPSDPDFPFDIEALECVLTVPSTYPKGGRPSLRVTNKEMGRGYQINVERGFDSLAARSPGSTLLQLMNALDKQLETLLAAPKADTVKLVANVGRPQPSIPPPVARPDVPAPSRAKPALPVSSTSSPAKAVYAAEQKAQASVRREQETRQLEARMSKLPQYCKSSDGTSYVLPLEPRRRQDLPVPLQAIKTVRLVVPVLYNLEPCRIELMGVSGDYASSVEKAFKDRVAQDPQMSLLNHLNYLSQNMHTIAVQAAKAELPQQPEVSRLKITEEQAPNTLQAPEPSTSTLPAGRDPDRSHIVHVPRPPEWTVVEDNDEDTDDSFAYDTGDETEDVTTEDEEHDDTEAPKSTPERGILLSFPHLELYGIELLELVSLSITVKCDRCKDTMDIPNLKNNSKGDYTGVRSESCKKCANALGIGEPSLVAVVARPG